MVTVYGDCDHAFDTMRDGEGGVVLVSKDGKTVVPTNYRYRP